MFKFNFIKKFLLDDSRNLNLIIIVDVKAYKLF